MAVVAISLVTLLACDATTVPATPTPRASTQPDAGDSFLTLAIGPWRPMPITVDADASEALVEACRARGGPAIEQLPPAVLDARGEGRVLLIFADDARAFECRANVGRDGRVTLEEEPARLDPGSASIGDDDLELTSFIPDETGERRSILLGRVGRSAANVKIGLDDESEVAASNAGGWFAAWWPGSTVPAVVTAVDSSGRAVRAVPVPGGFFEGRIGPASWWLDPDRPPPSPDSLVIPALISERACASGRSPEGRVVEPEIFSAVDALLIAVWVRRLVGGQDCPGNPLFPIEIELGEPLGDRRLLDGSEIPPRDATVPPK